MEKTGTKYVRCTSKDYSMSFKLSVVREYGTGCVSLGALQRKYGIQGNETVKRWVRKDRHPKKLLSRAVTQYKEEKSVSISGICRLPGVSRQTYYRQEWRMSCSRRKATEVVDMVRSIRMEMPRMRHLQKT